MEGGEGWQIPNDVRGVEEGVVAIEEVGDGNGFVFVGASPEGEEVE